MSNQSRSARVPDRHTKHRRQTAKSAYLTRRKDEARAAKWLWQSLVAVTARAGEQGLDTDDLGYVAMEFAVGVLALGFEKDELVEWLRYHTDAIEHGTHYTVNLGQIAQGYPVDQPPAQMALYARPNGGWSRHRKVEELLQGAFRFALLSPQSQLEVYRQVSWFSHP